MRSLLHQLENNDAVLLMYLAGELPADDRAEVEQQLAADAVLRASLEAMRQAQGALGASLARADVMAMPPAVEAARTAAAVRRVSRAMVKLHAERQAAAATGGGEGPRRTLRLLPNWAYPFAAAAV